MCICCFSDWSLSPSQVLSGGRVLSFHSALVSDTGRYTCVAVNAGGEQQREYDLRVYGESINIGSSVPARIVISFYILVDVCKSRCAQWTLTWLPRGTCGFYTLGFH